MEKSSNTVNAQYLESYKALDKREYCLFLFKTYDVTPQMNRLIETVQMRGHNIWNQ